MEQYEQASSYEKFGFVIIRNVLLPEEIRDIRKLLLKQLAAYPERERVFTEEVFQCPEIYRLAFREKVVRMLTVWLSMCPTVVTMARRGAGDIPGNDPGQVFTSYSTYTHV